jgi:NADH:ubiquinone oxidoreductase subunit K
MSSSNLVFNLIGLTFISLELVFNSSALALVAFFLL